MSTAISFGTVAGQAPRIPSPRASATGASTPRSRLRLTRRGRAVLTSLAALPIVVGATVSVLGAGIAAADGGERPAASFEVVTIGHGDTLWELAETVAPAEDPREVIADIVKLNGLDDAVVQVGQKLALPAYE